MSDDQFQRLCNTFGFAPSRALREMLDAATRQAVIAEREECAEVAAWILKMPQNDVSHAIRARGDVA